MRELNLNQDFNAPVAGNAAFDPIKRITVVGGFDTCRYGGECHDSKDLTAIVDYLQLQGVVGSGKDGEPDIDVNVMNLAYGQNFLQDTPQTDLVVISYLPNPCLENLSKISDREGYTSSDIKKDFHLVVSANHNEESWKDCIKNSGAKIVFSIGGLNELTTWNLEQPDFRVLQHPPARYMRGRSQGRYSSLSLINGFYGLMVTNNYIADIVNHSDPANDSQFLCKIRKFNSSAYYSEYPPEGLLAKAKRRLRIFRGL